MSGTAVHAAVRTWAVVLAGAALALVLWALTGALAGSAGAAGLPAAGVAHADPAAPPARPYGGALENPEPGDAMNGEQVLEVAMLGFGALNGVAVLVAVVLNRTHGASAAETRRALRQRTGAGVVSESRRDRRESREAAVAAPVMAVMSGLVGTPSGPRSTSWPVVDPEPVLPPLRAVPAQSRGAAVPHPRGPQPDVPVHGSRVLPSRHAR